MSQGSSFYCHCLPGYSGHICNNGKITPPSTVTVYLDTRETPVTMVRLLFLILLLYPWILRRHLVRLCSVDFVISFEYSVKYLIFLFILIHCFFQTPVPPTPALQVH